MGKPGFAREQNRFCTETALVLLMVLFQLYNGVFLVIDGATAVFKRFLSVINWCNFSFIFSNFYQNKNLKNLFSNEKFIPIKKEKLSIHEKTNKITNLETKSEFMKIHTYIRFRNIPQEGANQFVPESGRFSVFREEV